MNKLIKNIKVNKAYKIYNNQTKYFTQFNLNKDYYSILGLNKNASDKEIKDSYYKLAKTYHPDLNSGKTTEKFKEMTDAYDILSDSKLKSDYDQKRSFNFNNNFNFSNNYRKFTFNDFKNDPLILNVKMFFNNIFNNNKRKNNTFYSKPHQSKNYSSNNNDNNKNKNKSEFARKHYEKNKDYYDTFKKDKNDNNEEQNSYDNNTSNQHHNNQQQPTQSPILYFAVTFIGVFLGSFIIHSLFSRRPVQQIQPNNYDNKYPINNNTIPNQRYQANLSQQNFNQNNTVNTYKQNSNTNLDNAVSNASFVRKSENSISSNDDPFRKN